MTHNLFQTFRPSCTYLLSKSNILVMLSVFWTRIWHEQQLNNWSFSSEFISHFDDFNNQTINNNINEFFATNFADIIIKRCRKKLWRDMINCNRKINLKSNVFVEFEQFCFKFSITKLQFWTTINSNHWRLFRTNIILEQKQSQMFLDVNLN